MKNINEQNKDVKETVTASFDIPSRIYLFSRRPIGETKEIVVEHLRNQAMSICDLLAYGAACVQSGNFDEKIFIDSVGVLANIASNHIEAIEIVERDKDGELESASLPTVKETLGDLGADSLTAHLVNRMKDRLIAVLESPDVPEAAKNALSAIAENAIENGHFVESPAEVIQNRFSENLLSCSEPAIRATLNILTAVMENCIPDEIYLPIHKANMEKFNERKN